MTKIDKFVAFESKVKWIYFVILIGLYSQFVNAQGRLNYEFKLGRESYTAHLLDGSFQLSPNWSLVGDLLHARTGSQHSTEILLGPKIVLSPDFKVDVRLGGMRSNYQLRSRSIKPSTTWNIAALWSGALRTELAAGFDLTRITDDFRSLSYTETGVDLAIDQEVMPELALGLSFSKTLRSEAYERNLRPFVMRSASSTLISSRAPGSAYGRTDRSLGMSMNYVGWESSILDVSFMGSKAEGISGTTFTPTTKYTRLLGESWDASLGTSLSLLKDSPAFYAFTLGVGYLF